MSLFEKRIYKMRSTLPIIGIVIFSIIYLLILLYFFLIPAQRKARKLEKRAKAIERILDIINEEQ